MHKEIETEYNNGLIRPPVKATSQEIYDHAFVDIEKLGDCIAKSVLEKRIYHVVSSAKNCFFENQQQMKRYMHFVVFGVELVYAYDYRLGECAIGLYTPYMAFVVRPK